MNVPTTLLLLAALAGMIWTLFLVPRREGPGRLPLIGVLCTSAWWSAGIFLQSLPLAPEIRIFIGYLVWWATSLASSFYCFLLWDVTFLGKPPIPKGFWIAAVVFSVSVDCLAPLNPGHLFYLSVRPAPGNLGPPIYVHGPLFSLVFAILYGQLLVMIGYTAWRQRGRSARRRRIYFGVVLANLAPLIMGALKVAHPVHFFTNDPTPFAFLVTAPVLAWLLIRNQLCDPMPIARSALLGVLPDAVIVLDADGRVAEANPPALRLPGMPARAVGLEASAIPTWSGPIAEALEDRDGPLSVRIPLDPPRYYELATARLEEDGLLCGHLLMFRDMTQRQDREIQLRTALGGLSEQLAENRRLQDELHGQARRDPLTTLFNRRALEETLRDLSADTARADQPVAAVMIDLDHFKAINDTFGHGFGDAVLKTFASRLLAMSREGDLIFRVGGEEFLALLPGASLAEAVEVAERWLAVFRAGVQVEGRTHRLTFSAGVAVAAASEVASSQLIERADAAAYGAKRGGRDRILTHEPALP